MSEAICLMVLKTIAWVVWKSLGHFIDPKYWPQAWAKKGDNSQGLVCEVTSVPVLGGGLKEQTAGFEVNFENKAF